MCKFWSLLCPVLMPLLCLLSCGGGGGGSKAAPPVGGGGQLQVTPTTLAPAHAHWPCWIDLDVQGGQAPYTYALSGGALPAGMKLTAGGELQGIPATPGKADFTLTVQDSSTPALEGKVDLSLQVDQPWSTAMPATPRNTFFLHHSVGYHLYYRLGVNGLAAKLMLGNFTTYNIPGKLPLDMTYGQGKVGSYVIGDHTDPGDLPVNFNTPAYFQAMYTWNLPSGQNHQVMMFKSCYPASAIASESELEDYKRYYRSMLPTFKSRPATLFIPLSTPPLNPVATNKEEGARARRFARWLKYEYSAQLPNLVAFDLFAVLANGEDHPTEPNMLKSAYRKGNDSHPTEAGDQAVIDRFIPFINAAVRAAGMEP